MKYDIITIGSATRDVFLVSKEIKIIGQNECVALGTKIELDHLIISTGGGATNAAVTFSHLGFKTATIARVGQDCSGAEIVGELNDCGVDTRLMSVIPGEQTAYSTLLTESKGGERTILVYRGVSSSFSETDIPWSKIKTDWIYMTSLADNTGLVKKIVDRLGAKTKIVWNPGSADIKKGWKVLKPIVSKLCLLIMNREEADALFGKDNIPTLPKHLTLIVTDGPRGASAHLDGQTWSIKAGRVKTVSRTGAGDAFGSGLVAGLMKGLGIEEAMKVGLTNAESVIQHFGAKTGILKKWPKV